MGEGAAPFIWFPSLDLPFAGFAEARAGFPCSSTKRSGRRAEPTAKRQKSLPSTVSSNPVEQHARRRAFFARSGYFALDCF
jgi:hypothetical protein